MALKEKFSIWKLMVPDLRSEIGESLGEVKYQDGDLIQHLKRATSRLSDVLGLSTNVSLAYSFRPLNNSDYTLIDPNIYENVDNISMNYKIYLTDTGSAGSIESKAVNVRQMQIGMMKIIWSLSGTGGTEPSIDVSFDKDIDSGDILRGTYLVNLEKIPAIVSGAEVDTSMLVANTFSLKWLFPSGSGYAIDETIVELMLINLPRMYSRKLDIVGVAASRIFDQLAIDASRSGSASSYVEYLERKRDKLASEVQGRIGSNAAPSIGVDSLKVDIDRTTYASRAFGRKRKSDRWVQIIGNQITGRTVRFVDD